MRGFTAGPPVYGSGWTAGILPACGPDGRGPVEIRLPLMTVMETDEVFFGSPPPRPSPIEGESRGGSEPRRAASD
jgi:hypothetical protein